ncbi:hypothetical protein M1D89_04655 [Arthrobacter sp. D3-18]
MVLDLKLNTSFAFALGTFGWASIGCSFMLIDLAWQFEKLQNWYGFLLALFYGVLFGLALAGLTLWLQVASSRRRQLLKAALVLMRNAQDYGPTTPANTKRFMAASGQKFLKAAFRLGLTGENRHILCITHYLSDQGRYPHRNVNTLLVREIGHLVREVYQGEHSMSMQRSRRFSLPQPSAVLKTSGWITSLAAAPVLARLLSGWEPFL